MADTKVLGAFAFGVEVRVLSSAPSKKAECVEKEVFGVKLDSLKIVLACLAVFLFS